MALGKIAAAAALSALVLGATPASAHCYRHCNPVVGILSLPFAIVAGAATIATAPFVIVGDALSGGYAPPPRPAYGEAPYGDGPYAYAPPAYGPPPVYYGPRARFYYGPRYFHRHRYYRY